MLHCITNSKILKESLEFVSDDEREKTIKEEFEKMCLRFNLNELEMIALVTTPDLSLFDTHYETIWESLNYYSMTCMSDYKNAYIEWIYKNDLKDSRIDLLCNDLQEYIKESTCIHVRNKVCDTLKNACRRKHDECIKYLLNNPNKHNSKNDVVYVKNYSTRIYDANRGFFFNDYDEMYDCTNIIDYMCACGASLNIIKYLFEVRHMDCTTRAINLASNNCHLDVVKYLFETQHKDCTTDAIDWASRSGHLDIVKYLFEVQNKDCTTRSINNACKHGHLDIVKYLFEVQHVECTKDAVDYASYGGHLDVVKYLFEEQHKDCTPHAIDEACRNGHLDVVKYLFEEQHKNCTIYAMDWARRNRRLDVEKYLSEYFTYKNF